MRQFDLWDVELGKYLGRFERESDAIEFVRALLDRYGDAYADDLALGATDDEDGSENLTGAALAERARALTPAAPRAGD
jgi:hypothetical protein